MMLTSLRRFFGKSTPNFGRRWTRLLMTEPARLKCGDRGPEQQVMLKDFSAGGACVRASTGLRAGDFVALTVNLGFGFKYELSSQVIYVCHEPLGYSAVYGLRFVSVLPDQVRRIANFIADEQQRRSAGVRISK